MSVYSVYKFLFAAFFYTVAILSCIVVLFVSMYGEEIMANVPKQENSIPQVDNATLLIFCIVTGIITCLFAYWPYNAMKKVQKN